MSGSALSLGSREGLASQPFADGNASAFGRRFHLREFVVGEADGHGVGSGVVAAGSSHLGHVTRIAYAVSLARPDFGVYDKCMHTTVAQNIARFVTRAHSLTWAKLDAEKAA